jgi:hypothetical protein
MTILVFSIYFKFGSFFRENIFFMPFIKYPNVRNMFERTPLFDCRSNTEQQLSIFNPVQVYHFKIVIKVVKPAKAYPIAYANAIPVKLKPNV